MWSQGSRRHCQPPPWATEAETQAAWAEGALGLGAQALPASTPPPSPPPLPPPLCGE